MTITHIPGISNAESRVQEERTAWMFSKPVFDDIIKEHEFKPGINLFASRLKKQIPNLFHLDQTQNP